MLKISIDDGGLEVSVRVSAKAAYNPDVMNDLQARAMEIYERACSVKVAMARTMEDDE